MIFDFFPATEYDGKPTVDVFHNYTSYFNQTATEFILRTYLVTGSPRPELLSYQLYGDSNYHWLLLMANDIYDPFHDWVKDEEAVHQSAVQKYQNIPGGVNGLAYHINSKEERFHRLVEYPIGSSVWYDEGDSFHSHIQYTGTLIPVTNIEHELSVNEQKRVINIIAPSDLNRFIDSMKRIMEKVRDGN